jgi:hypothetical protein
MKTKIINNIRVFLSEKEHGGAVIIQDILKKSMYSESDWQYIQLISSGLNFILDNFEESHTQNNFQIKMFNAEYEIKKLENLIFYYIDFKRENTVFIYPGESARYIAQLQPFEYYDFDGEYQKIYVHAKRLWYPGNDPVVSVGIIPSKQNIDTNVETVIVVDDVISSGKTMALLQERNSWKYPRAKWYATALFSRKEKLPKYEKLLCSVYVPDINGKKPPINSLSTLVKNNEIQTSYLERNFKPSDVIKYFKFYFSSMSVFFKETKETKSQREILKKSCLNMFF